MSDARLRQLERRFRETGAPEDEAAWIQERLRAGLVRRDWLELAVFLGSRAAADALGDTSKVPAPPRTGVKGWVRKMEPWGAIPCLRAAIAATRMLVKDGDPSPHPVALARLHLAEAYAVEPRPELIEEVRRLHLVPFPAEPRWRASALCGTIVDFVQHGNQFVWKAKVAADVVAEEVGGERPVRAAITAELLPWALGTGDPVRERVESRGRVS